MVAKSKKARTELSLPLSFVNRVKALRRTKNLHPTVITELQNAVAVLFPDWISVGEIAQTPGGRNDTVLFEGDGQSICFELFASKGQVDRDLLLLHNSPAQRKIAIVIDPEIDESVMEKLYRKQPHSPYPLIRVSEILLEDRRPLLQLKLLHYVLGNRLAEAIQISRQLANTAHERALTRWQKRGIDIFTGSGNPTISGVMALLTVKHLRQLGLAIEQCEDAAKLVSESAEHIIMQIVIGGPYFLLRHQGKYFFMDHVDYASWDHGSILVGDGDLVRVLLNSVYDELKATYKGNLPEAGGVTKFM